MAINKKGHKKTEKVKLSPVTKLNTKFGAKLSAVVLTVMIISILVVSSPAQALNLNLNSSKSKISRGESVIFDASILINSNQPIQKLELDLSGPEKVSCFFNEDGSIISGCKGMTIRKISTDVPDSGYGYSYGYGYGSEVDPEYEITLASDDYKTGDYTSSLKAFIGDQVFTKDGSNLNIAASSAVSDSYYYGHAGTTKVCLNNGWTCSDWSGCSDGMQSRSCTARPNCYLDTRPQEQRSCLITLTSGSGLNGNTYDGLESTINLNSPNNGNSGSSGNSGSESDDPTVSMSTSQIFSNTLSGITGAVIGATSSPSQLAIIVAAIVLAIILGLIIGLVIVRVSRRSRRMRKIRELNRIRYIPPKQ
ncbi:Uncharacterised protein [uncultured archaeon]|nr:Uncharacterised protein [uncultured archaeon]